MASLNATLRTLARQYAAALRAGFKDDLVSVVLFGSVARGEATPMSDIDLFIVARNLPRGRVGRLRPVRGADRRIEARLRSLRSKGIHSEVCPILMTPEAASALRPLYLDFVEDAMLLYDRHGFFAGVLNRLRRRLRELGSIRHRIGRTWYWELKPDYRPGEIFEL
jgi:predicted nucleotidyltransferase